MAFNQFEMEALEAHNVYRRSHGVPDLELDAILNYEAQQWANNIARMRRLQHSHNNLYGENLYATTGTNIDGATPVTVWYNEIKKYNFRQHGFSGHTGHFTQVLWKSSRKLGIGMAKNSEWIYVVANYSPPGNVMGQFPENVLPLR